LNYKYIRYKLKNILKEKNLSISALEKLIDVPIGTIRMFLNGRYKTLHFSHLEKLCTSFNIPLESLTKSDIMKANDPYPISPSIFKKHTEILCDILKSYPQVKLDFNGYKRIIQNMNEYLVLFNKNMDTDTIIFHISQSH
jgi:transcriptional regulator with XRE-family HTH domain